MSSHPKKGAAPKTTRLNRVFTGAAVRPQLAPVYGSVQSVNN